jgi:hypothetical protein
MRGVRTVFSEYWAAFAGYLPPHEKQNLMETIIVG